MASKKKPAGRAPLAKKAPAEKAAPKPPGSKKESAKVAGLVRHPKNYKEHPKEQLAHLAQSIREYGQYKNVVVARDGRTLLAGHGVVEAAKLAGVEKVDVVRLDLDPFSPAALKLVALDNESARGAISDDRALAEILRAIVDADVGLLGTGYDEKGLLALEMILGAPKGTNDPDSEWGGMPSFENEDQTAWGSVKVNFASEEDMKAFAKLVGQPVVSTTRSIWHPKAEIGHFADKAYVDGANGERRPEQA